MDMKLIVTIDVEEDNWGEFRPERYALENIRHIPELQRLFDDYAVRPTYLINYPVANDSRAVEMFGRYHAEGRCEIGMHCHPWNTPPYLEPTDCYHSMLCNLPEALQFSKLKALRDAIVRNFQVNPVTFRAGRWAFGSGVARSLVQLGFQVDTSVTPYWDWSEWHGVNYQAVSPTPYRFNAEDVFTEDSCGELLQVPVTIGYLQGDFAKCHRWYQWIDNSDLCQHLHLKGLLDRMSLLNRVILSPELCNGPSMIKLAKAVERRGYPFLNLFFHSTSIIPGCSPFVQDAAQLQQFFEALRTFMEYVRDRGIESILLKDTIDWYGLPGARQQADEAARTRVAGKSAGLAANLQAGH